MVVGIAVAGLLLLALVIFAVFYLRRQMARSEENKARLTARISGLEESEVSNHFYP
jgi:preprotein translocase subunit YajC